MSAWVVAVLFGVVLVSIGGGVGGILLLTKSIGPIASKAVKTGWQDNDITRLLRRVALLGWIILLLTLLPWSVVLTTLGGMADQYFRNNVNRWMGGADLFQHLAIEEDEYYKQPLHWRQALAEIALRKGDNEEAVRQFISRVGNRDIKILELVAKYALGGALLHLRTSADGNPVSELSTSDLIHLEAIGVIDSRLPLNHKEIRAKTDAPSGSEGVDELWLPGYQYAIRLQATTAGKSTSLSFVVLTEIGKDLVKALRRPTSLPYLCWLQGHFLERQVSAEVWSITRQGIEGNNYLQISRMDDACKS